MSGIVGIVYPDVFNIHMFLDPMLETLAHRCKKKEAAPQKETYTFRNVRLGITGGKIAENERKTLIALLDGHIYNYHELKNELTGQGYRFRTENEGELIIHAYDFWGEKFPEKFNGNFAIALFDRESQAIYLYRDPIGCKPLYWYYDRTYFLFASEIKSLLASGIIPQTPSQEALATYFSLGYSPMDMTMIKNVNKLLPANYLRYSLERGISIHSYWSYSEQFIKANRSREDDPLEKLNALLNDAVKIRTSSENDLGCFLSGGIGSASIASYVSRDIIGKEMPAFTVGFRGENEDDIQAAKAFAESMHLDHHVEALCPQDILDDFVEQVWCLDEPLADPNTIASWHLAKLGAKYSSVVFSGMGSDELLAGHTRYTIEERASPLLRNLELYWHKFLRNIVIPITRQIASPQAFRILRHAQEDVLQSGYLVQNRLFSEKQLAKASPLLADQFDHDIFLHRFDRLDKIPSAVESLLYIDFKTRLPDCYILQYERLNQAHGLDWRAPFLDLSIVEYLATIPEPENLAEKDTALLLKRIMKDKLPEKMLNRPKKIRRQLLQSWCRKDSLLEIFRYLIRGTLVETGIIDRNWLIRQTESYRHCEESFPLLWSILALEVWYRLYINFPIEAKCPNVSLKELLESS